MPFFSIIIPTFNSAKTLVKCIDSILKQSYDSFEILIIDGLSKDNTVKIANSFKDQRIKVTCETDKGIYDAMNKGVSLAKGNWIYFLGSDDSLYNESVLSSIANLARNDVILLYGNVIVQNKIQGEEVTIEKLFYNNICHQSIFYKKELFKKIGLFHTKYLASADWHHNLKWVKDSSIKKIYVETIIAIFNLGGFSTHYYDKPFHNYLNWEREIFQKKDTSFFDKLRISKTQILYTLKEKQFSSLIKSLVQIPRFLTKH